jgi:hypothetical protein
MCPRASALRASFQFIVVASRAKRNGLMVYALGYLDT